MPKLKKKKFRFTFTVFLRLAIFAAVVYFAISYLSKNHQVSQPDPTVLGTEGTKVKTITDSLYQQLPPQSQKVLQNLDKTPPVVFVQDKLNYLKQQTNGFPDKQIAEIKKNVINSILQKYLK